VLLLIAGIMIGHVDPEAAVGGPLAALREGDMVRIDLAGRSLSHLVDAAEFAARLSTWERRPLPPHLVGTVLHKYAHLVGGASEGAMTRPKAP
jgi:dihydroxy-acid dehydratase